MPYAHATTTTPVFTTPFCLRQAQAAVAIPHAHTEARVPAALLPGCHANFNPTALTESVASLETYRKNTGP